MTCPESLSICWLVLQNVRETPLAGCPEGWVGKEQLNYVDACSQASGCAHRRLSFRWEKNTCVDKTSLQPVHHSCCDRAPRVPLHTVRDVSQAWNTWRLANIMHRLAKIIHSFNSGSPSFLIGMWQKPLTSENLYGNELFYSQSDTKGLYSLQWMLTPIKMKLWLLKNKGVIFLLMHVCFANIT